MHLSQTYVVNGAHRGSLKRTQVMVFQSVLAQVAQEVLNVDAVAALPHQHDLGLFHHDCLPYHKLHDDHQDGRHATFIAQHAGLVLRHGQQMHHSRPLKVWMQHLVCSIFAFEMLNW